MTDREAIQAAMQRVQSGELSPEQATQQLLAAQNAEPLDSLIERLGSPPADIVTGWCDQLRLIASAHEAAADQPLPEIELNQWAITAQGDLLYQGRRFKISDDAPRASQTSLDRIQAFQLRWISEQQVNPGDTSDSKASQIPCKQRQLPDDAAVDRPDPAKSKKSTPLFSSGTVRALSVVGIGFCAVAAIYVLFRASQPSGNQVAQQSAASKAPAATPVPLDAAADRPTTEAVNAEPIEASVALETFDAQAELEAESQIESELSMSLAGLLPPIDALGNDDAESNPQSSDPIDPDSPSDADSDLVGAGAAESIDPTEPELTGPADSQLADEEPVPEESPQQTRRSTVSSVQLVAADDLEATVTLADRSLTGLEVGFPFEVPLEIKEENSKWSIRDTRKDVVLATIRSGDDRTELSWSETAKQSPNASALAHGRITHDSGSTIFLRPTIESDPWKFRFDQSDVIPTWHLNHSIPPRATRLDVAFELPEEIEFGWVEPVVASELRRTRATAIITPVDDEEIALGIRFDIRCGQKLSCRMRFAAQLDPAMNWQVVSTPLLNEFANQLTDRATVISNESERLAKVYSALDNRDARRYIRAKQDHVKQLTAQVTTAAERVARLQTLMAQLESQAAIGFRVWVEWPDTKQTLLSAMSSDAAESKSE